jgi:hypothetical protein
MYSCSWLSYLKKTGLLVSTNLPGLWLLVQLSEDDWTPGIYKSTWIVAPATAVWRRLVSWYLWNYLDCGSGYSCLKKTGLQVSTNLPGLWLLVQLSEDDWTPGIYKSTWIVAPGTAVWRRLDSWYLQIYLDCGSWYSCLKTTGLLVSTNLPGLWLLVQLSKKTGLLVSTNLPGLWLLVQLSKEDWTPGIYKTTWIVALGTAVWRRLDSWYLQIYLDCGTWYSWLKKTGLLVSTNLPGLWLLIQLSEEDWTPGIYKSTWIVALGTADWRRLDSWYL